MDEKELGNNLVVESLRKAFRVFGVEGTEEVLKRVLKPNSKMLEVYLEAYRQLLKGGKE